MIIYLIGPSGVGKSSAVALLHDEHPEILVIDIDSEYLFKGISWDVIQNRLITLGERQADDGHVVVDIGASAQVWSALHTFLQETKANGLLVIAPPEEVILRNPLGPDRDFPGFMQMEYVERADLYELASATVDVTGLDRHEAAQLVVERLVALLGGHEGNA